GRYGSESAQRPYPRRQCGVAARVVPVDAAAEDGDRSPTRLERAPMCLAVNSARQTADDHKARCGKLARERPCYLGTVGRAGACTHDGDAGLGQRLNRSAHEERLWRIVELGEQGWIPGVAPA